MAQLALPVNQPHGGYGIDTPCFGRWIRPVLSGIGEFPSQLFFLNIIIQWFFFPIQADADDFESLVFKFGIDILHIGYLRQAGAAPGGPEIHQDDLSLLLWEGEGFTGNQLQCKVFGLFTNTDILLNFFNKLFKSLVVMEQFVSSWKKILRILDCERRKREAEKWRLRTDSGSRFTKVG